jgi:hypothetical protein
MSIGALNKKALIAVIGNKVVTTKKIARLLVAIFNFKERITKSEN